jgi:hypothetical protein
MPLPSVKELPPTTSVEFVDAANAFLANLFRIQFHSLALNTSIELCYSYRNGLDSGHWQLLGDPEAKNLAL